MVHVDADKGNRLKHIGWVRKLFFIVQVFHQGKQDKTVLAQWNLKIDMKYSNTEW